jgi:uncharacterized protein (DUF885 family)
MTAYCLLPTKLDSRAMKRLPILAALPLALACTTQSPKPQPPQAPPPSINTTTAALPPAPPSEDERFRKFHDEYVREFLRRNPEVNTYLGGAGLDPTLAEADGRLRDHSSSALDVEDRWLGNTLNHFDAIDRSRLSPRYQIDWEVAQAQIHFLLHQHEIRTYQRKSLDTYTDEPFRSIDFQLQGLTNTGPDRYGSSQEWALVASRLADIPRYLSTAQEQLRDGIRGNTTPDVRVLYRNGILTSESDAKYFDETLPALADERIGTPDRDQLVATIRERSKAAAAAYRDFGKFIATTFFDDPSRERGVKSQFAGERFVLGEAEYNWALGNNLRVKKTAAQLFEQSWPIVEETQRQMVDLARQIAAAHGWSMPQDGNAAVRAVFDQLSKDFPKSDAEMIDWYRRTAFRLVDYARKTGIFDVPSNYKLEVVETPPPLQSSIDGAAYYPAPPFKDSGVGRFYVTPTHNDVAQLQQNNRSALADLAAHEGFPGHDWYYKVQTQFRDTISPIRWLTPGAVEDSSSMWEDSMASEGWALYSEGLMAEAQPKALEGFYTPEERLYQLQGKLYRDLRVRVDTGIHTGRIKYDDAVDLFSQIVDFLPGSCRDAGAVRDEAKRASCKTSEAAIFRYSKWPTQAITYRLGRDEIVDLRNEATRKLGDRFSPKRFHLLFIRQGTIPAGYFREELLHELGL